MWKNLLEKLSIFTETTNGEKIFDNCIFLKILLATIGNRSPPITPTQTCTHWVNRKPRSIFNQRIYLSSFSEDLRQDRPITWAIRSKHSRITQIVSGIDRCLLNVSLFIVLLCLALFFE